MSFMAPRTVPTDPPAPAPPPAARRRPNPPPGRHWRGALVAFLTASLTGAGLGTAWAQATGDLVAASAPSAWTIERLSVPPAGGEADGESYQPVLSSDGTTVAFESTATNLTDPPSPTGMGGNILAMDLETRASSLVSLDSNGARLAYPYDPAINGDGSIVAMTHGGASSNRVAIRDTLTRQTTVLTPTASPTKSPSVDSSGTRIAFLEADPDFDDVDQRQYVWVHDTGAATGSAPTTTKVIDLVSFTQLALDPVISADGWTVAAEVRDDRLREVRLVDLHDPGAAPLVIAGAEKPALSGDGRVVAHLARVNGTEELRTYDRATGETALALTMPASSYVARLDLSDDGSTLGVAVEGIANELWMVDVASGRTEVLAETGYSYATGFDVGSNGRTVVFTSTEDGVVPEDTNRMADVFLAVRSDTVGPVWPAGAQLGIGTVGSSYAQLSWPAATDDLGIEAYELTQDGLPVARLAPTATSYTATGLQPESSYTFSVVAVDGSDNTSSPLTGSVFTEPAGQPGSAALLAEAGAGGQVHLSWEPAAGTAGYAVLRAEAGGELVTVAEIGPDVAAHTDSSLAASTAYRYRVDALVDGVALPHTVEAEATTADLAATAAGWQGRGLIDFPVAVTIDGAPGWLAVAEVTHRTWFAEDGSLLSSPRVATTFAPASEDVSSPGRYLAEFVIPDGTVEVVSVAGLVGDGHGHEARVDAVRPPLAVAGAVRATVAAPAGALPGARIVLDGVAQEPIEGAHTWDVRSAPEGTRPVRVFAADGRELGTASVSVVAGLRSEVTVTPQVPGALVVRALLDGAPTASAQVLFSAAGSQLVIGSATTDANGLAVAPGSLMTGDQVDVSVIPPAGLPYERTTASVTVERDGAPTDIDVRASTPGRLVGLVTVGAGEPLPGATFSISQTVGRMAVSTLVTTDDQGRFDYVGVAGWARIASVQGNAVAPSLSVEIGPETVTKNIHLGAPAQYKIDLRLFVRTLEDPTWRGPLEIDHINAIHYRLRVNGAVPYGNVTSLTGRPGETIRVCGDGVEAGMSAQCVDVELSTETTIPVELRLESAAGVVGRVVAGQPGADLRSTRVEVSAINDAGAARFIWSYLVLDERIDIRVAEAGRYRFRVVSNSSIAMSAVVERDLAQGELLDLGDVVVSSSPWSASGIAPTRNEVAHGSPVELRGVVVPTVFGDYVDLRASIDIPAGTTLLADSVTVDGTPATATVADGVATIHLGQRSISSATDAPVVRLWLDTTGVPATVSELGVTMTASGTRNGVVQAGLAGSTLVRLSAITIEVPETSTSHEVVLSGRAPAGSEVVVHERAAEIGTTTATDGGLWRLKASLPDFGSGFEHVLHATVEIDGAILRSGDESVVVDERQPELEQVVITAPSLNGSVSAVVDPDDGVARFPMVFRGGPITVSGWFAGRGTVNTVNARVGSGRAAGQTADRQFTASVPAGTFTLGPVALSVRSTPDMATLEDVPVLTEGQLGQALPPQLLPASEPVVTSSEDPATGTRTGSVTYDTAFGPERTTLSMTRGLVYTPTEQDEAMSREAGVPAYGLTWSSTISSTGSVVISGSIYVPESLLYPSEGVSAFSGFGVVRVGFQRAFERGTQIDGAITLWGTKDKWEKLNELADQIDRHCSASDADLLRPRLEAVAIDAAVVDGLKAGMMVAGALLAPATFGIGTVGVWAVGFFLEKVIDLQLNKSIDALKRMADEWCPEPGAGGGEEDGDDTVADPTWIHDPSGYVFEAVPSNRVEGATATLLYSPAADGPFTVWDAEWYGQQNPLVTDDAGAYGWDVPEGFWQVLYTKDGYETARSEVLEVLPPHFDVNVGLRSVAAPEVTAASATGGDPSSVDVTFSRYMRLDTADRISVTAADGEPVAGTVTAVDGEDGPTGRFARTFRFTPAAPFAEGEQLGVSVDALATSYADRPMAGPFTGTLVVMVPDRTVPTVSATVTPAPNAAGWHAGPATVALAAIDDRSGIAEIRWTVEGPVPTSGSAGADAASVPVDGDGTHVVRYEAVDGAGNVSAQGTTEVRIDAAAPAATITSPAPGTTVNVGEALVAGYACDDAGSGIATCTGTVADGAPLTTATPGVYDLTVAAVDAAGNTTTTTVTYEVVGADASEQIDALAATVRSYGLPRIRQAVLLSPLATAKLALSFDLTGVACSAMTAFESVVQDYAAQGWLSPEQASSLTTGSVAVRTTLGC
jgi:hypothetical protein